MNITFRCKFCPANLLLEGVTCNLWTSFEIDPSLRVPAVAVKCPKCGEEMFPRKWEYVKGDQGYIDKTQGN
jgi:predicted RNA-binding Zn-ribbon protein involved in translation (DUF1610 family)